MSDVNNSMYGRSKSIPVVVSNKAIDFSLAFPDKSTLPITMEVCPVNKNLMSGTVETTPVTKFVKVINTNNDTYVRSSVPLLSYYDKATLKAGTLDDDIYKAYISFADLADQDEMIKKGLLKAELIFVKTAEDLSNNVRLYALEKEFEQNNVNYNIDLGNAGIIQEGVVDDNRLIFDITSHMRKIMKGEVIDKGFGLMCDDGLVDVYSCDSTINNPQIVLTYYDSSKNHRIESIFASIKTMVQPIFETYASIEIEQDRTEIIGSIGVLANGIEEITASLEAEEPIHYGKTDIIGSMVTEKAGHVENSEIIGSIGVLANGIEEITASLEAEEPIHYGKTDIIGSMVIQKEIVNDAVTVNASIEIEQDMTEINSSISLYGEEENNINGSVVLLDFDKTTKPIELTLIKQDIASIPLNVNVIFVSYMTGSVFYEQENGSYLDGYVQFVDEKVDKIDGSLTMVDDLSKAINGSLTYLKESQVTEPFELILVKQDVVSKEMVIDFRASERISGRVTMSVDSVASLNDHVIFVSENEQELSGKVNFLEDMTAEQIGSVTYMEDKTSKINGIVNYVVDRTKAIDGSINFMGEIEQTLNGSLTFINTNMSKINGNVSYEVNNMRFIDGYITFETNDMSTINGIVSYSIDSNSQLNGCVVFIDDANTSIDGNVTFVMDRSTEIDGTVTMLDDLENNINGNLVFVEDVSISLEGKLTMVDDTTDEVDGSVTFLDDVNEEINGMLMMELSHGESTKLIEFVYSRSYITTRIIEN